MKNKYKMIDWTDDKIKKYWDFLSQYPDQYFTYQVGGEFVKRMSKYIVNATNILDYGAGPGHLIPYLLKTNSYIYALEFSDESAKKMFNQYNTAKGFKGVFTYEELVNKQMRFDVIIIVEVIEHLNDEHLNAMVTKVKQIMSDKSVVIITTPNDEDLSKELVYCPESDIVFHRWQHVRNWTKETLKNFLVEDARLRIIDIFETDFSNSGSWCRSIYVAIKDRINKIRGRNVSRKKPHLVAVVEKP